MQLRAIFALAVAAVIAQAGAAVKRGNDCDPRCHQDACLAEVVGKELGRNYAQAREDCKSFLRTTVTPVHTVRQTTTTTVTPYTSTQVVGSTTTIPFTTSIIDTLTAAISSTTTVVTTTDTTTTISILPRTDAPAASIPRYAHDCRDAAQYRSACSCIGVHEHTVTAPASTQTVSRTRTSTVTGLVTSTSVATSTSTLLTTVTFSTTVTSTISQTSTAVEIATPVPATFNIQVIQSDNDQNLGLLQLFPITQNDGRFYPGGNAINAALFNLDTSGNLFCVSANEYTYTEQGSNSLVFYYINDVEGFLTQLPCTLFGSTVSPGDTGGMTCSDPGVPFPILCGDYWDYSIGADPSSGCAASNPVSIYLEYVIVTPALIQQPTRRDL